MDFRRENPLSDLGAIARDLTAQFETELVNIVPHIYRNRMQISSTVESTKSVRWFKPGKSEIILSIILSEGRDRETIEPMVKRFVKDYLAQPENQNYFVRIRISLASKQKMENLND